MTTIRTVTVRDHEATVRAVAVDRHEPPAVRHPQKYTAITGGRRTAVLTTVTGGVVILVALLPVLAQLIH